MAVVIEIFVVVFGVLVALQVNEWAERRQEHALEHSYLLRLKEDLQMERAQADRFQRIVNQRLEAIALLERIAKNPRDEVRDPRMVPWAIETVSWGSFPPVHNIAYAELQSTGRTGLIRSIPLRRALAEHYAEVDDFARPAQDRTGQDRFDSDTAGLLTAAESMAVEQADGDYERMPPIDPARARVIAAGFAKRRGAIDELPGLAEHHVFDRRIMDGMQSRLNALIARTEREIGGNGRK